MAHASTHRDPPIPEFGPPIATLPAADQAGTYRAGPHWVALLATAFTWPLLFVGGLVTTYKVGMAVPDWPTTFGINMFLYDMTRASWAVFGEHTHRLYGAAVGLLTILLMLDFLFFERRRWMKLLGVAALVAVIGQGVLGGFRVRLNSTFLASVHGSTAQAFFGLMVALCVLTSRSWFRQTSTLEGGRKVGRMAVALVALIYAQIVVGAWVRHYPGVGALMVHASMAMLVFGHAAMLAARVLANRGQLRPLLPSTWALMATMMVQVTLGIGAWWLLRPFDGVSRDVSLIAALVRTGHQANAGLFLAASVVLAIRGSGQVSDPSPAESRRPAAAFRDLEAVA